MFRYPHSKLMVFSKAPIPGEVKTRLAKTLGDTVAAEIHRFLVRHCLKSISSTNLAPIELWCSPSSNHPFFYQCRDEFGVTLENQGEGNLGERMSQAFVATLSDTQSALVIGTDCPSINVDYLDEAFTRLTEKECTVIGPAEDGGYVLLGMAKHHSSLFDDISWGTDKVFEETRSKVSGVLELLPLQCDIDDEKDLWKFRKEMSGITLESDFRRFLEAM